MQPNTSYQISCRMHSSKLVTQIQPQQQQQQQQPFPQGLVWSKSACCLTQQALKVAQQPGCRKRAGL